MCHNAERAEMHLQARLAKRKGCVDESEQGGKVPIKVEPVTALGKAPVAGKRAGKRAKSSKPE